MDHNHQHTSAVNIPPLKPKRRDYIPLLIILGIIVLATGAVALQTGFTYMHVLSYLMGFFFLIFGMFKLLDITNFAMGYREYDLIAKRIPAWGYLYPFIEIALGAAYLAGLNMLWLNIVTLVLSALICLGVSIKLSKHEIIQCVCLGNILKVPLTYVSLIEYAFMGSMAFVMLFI